MSETGNSYEAEAGLPPLVASAVKLARDTGFGNSCIPAVGRLLRALAAARPGGAIGETGTGCGVGAAWIVSGMDSSTTLFTVEQDEDRAMAVRRLFEPYPNVHVLHGDWRDLGLRGPYTMLFLDGGGGKSADQDVALSMVESGGLIVLDDLTPESHQPPEWRLPGWVDPVRSWWLHQPDIAATEILTTPATAAILAVRRSVVR
jgi:predicted O-methyltransferase YrrM